MDAFQKKMMKTVKNNIQIFDKVKFRYQRGLELGQMQKWRKTKQVNQLRAVASSSMPLAEDWLLLTTDGPPLPPCIENSHSRMERLMQMRNAAIINIDKKPNSKKTTLSPQAIVHYEAVKSFMKRQRVVMVGDSRQFIAYSIEFGFLSILIIVAFLICIKRSIRE
jgi:hypothetical protein